ncbi:MAG: nucleoside triphosphate pyrophosphohydrolase [candidate division Zixibacteria bacterium]|nr:nucleoside triphosphate pyrophosphohydrolase [candidate division Zixibacteria bacterium]MDH3936995.1 nucleoside triphosphate pyrophosphohydrolase [candidate division Zixibacteria bacterium]MDH4033666.1 nucleoside triphosphate pyrophosphohydrolase [candidate division Zixibacteria bacterium]
MSELKSRVTDPNLPPWERLKLVMSILRSSDGCAWDQKQTHHSLIPYLIEESYEVVEAIEADNADELREELGDLLCQIVFHAQIADEKGKFDADDAVEGIVQKLITRHPHVFEKRAELAPQQVRDQWERLKIANGEKPSVLSGLPKSMPALTMAYRIGEKAGGVGFDWPDADRVFDKLTEEMDEIRRAIKSADSSNLEEEIGDFLFAASSLARKLMVEPETALKRALTKFRLRFSGLEEEVRHSQRDFDQFSLEELEAIWQRLKSQSTGDRPGTDPSDL